MIDKQLVIRKLALIAGDIVQLEVFAAQSEQEYLSSPINEAAAERYLERTIGRMIDVNYHLVTELGNPPPKDYFNSFTELARSCHILEPEFAKTIAHAAGLRNRIVHEYDDLDPVKIYDAIRHAVEDIPIYMDAVTRFLEKHNA